MASSDKSLSQKIDIAIHSPRRTRSRNKEVEIKQSTGASTESPAQPQIPAFEPTNIVRNSSIQILPLKLSRNHTRLGVADHSLLLRKEKWLHHYQIDIPGNRSYANKLAPGIQATLVFAQEEAGTAICISEEGFLLTCSHCVAETGQDLDYTKSHWLLFASGKIVEAKCVAWDSKRDLALLRIVSAQSEPVDSHQNIMEPGEFSAITIASSPPQLNTALVCVGHPGSEDLENVLPGVKTNYDVLHVSDGAFRGYAAGQDLQDNSEIGALQHDCWTYWGHSGAPLIERKTNRLVGLHSSWDDVTAMRRGVPLEAIQEFMREHESLFMI
jgi:hypothetical protein